MLKKTRGFTLIELLVVIAIIAMLATVGFASYRSANVKARNSRRESDIQQFRAALEMYRTDEGAYPPYSCEGDASCPAKPGYTNEFDNGSSGVATLLIDEGYLGSVPHDPQYPNQPDYWYQADSAVPSGATYELCSYWEPVTSAPNSDCSNGGTPYQYINP